MEQPIAPYWQSECGRAVVWVGDCRKVMSQMKAEQFYSVVTDPPYNLIQGGVHLRSMKRNGDGSDRTHQDNYKTGGFMGQKWDGTGVAFDLKTWEAVLRVAKPGAHLLSFGGTRTWHRMVCAIEDSGFGIRDTLMWVYGSGFPKSHNVSKAIDNALGVELEDEPVTEEAKQWQGWGTALKPAIETICLAHKPLVGTVAHCVMENGTGGLNIDACKIGVGETRPSSTGGMGRKANPVYGQFARTEVEIIETDKGRWPANLIHDGSDEVVKFFPDGAARYFYTAKADDSDRPHGKGATSHPTVKPLDLMRYLVRLVCVQGGTVLDPFMGSGSTGCAAILEGMRFVGIEQSQEYADMAVGRLRLALQGMGERETPPPPKRLRGAT